MDTFLVGSWSVISSFNLIRKRTLLDLYDVILVVFCVTLDVENKESGFYMIIGQMCFV